MGTTKEKRCHYKLCATGKITSEKNNIHSTLHLTLSKNQSENEQSSKLKFLELISCPKFDVLEIRIEYEIFCSLKKIKVTWHILVINSLLCISGFSKADELRSTFAFVPYLVVIDGICTFAAPRLLLQGILLAELRLRLTVVNRFLIDFSR